MAMTDLTGLHRSSGQQYGREQIQKRVGHGRPRDRLSPLLVPFNTLFQFGFRLALNLAQQFVRYLGQVKPRAQLRFQIQQ